MAFFDHQADILMTIIETFFKLVTFLQDYIDVQGGVYSSLHYFEHPMVSACTGSTGIYPSADCGPFQLFWDNYVTIWNNASVNQQASYPWLKGAVVLVDFTFLFLAFAAPLVVEFTSYVTKFNGILAMQKSEYAL